MKGMGELGKKRVSTRLIEVGENEKDEKLGLWNITQNNNFNYSILENEVRKDFELYDNKINVLVHGSMIALGQVLSEANGKYANHGDGIFGKWIESKGINKKKATRLISMFRYWETLDNEKKVVLQKLPVTLAYRVTSKSAEKELVTKVMNGEIKTNKKYVECLKEMKDQEEMEEAKIIEAEVLDSVEIITEPKKVEDIEEVEEIKEENNVLIKLLTEKNALEKDYKEFLAEVSRLKAEISDLDIKIEEQRNKNIKLFP